MDYMVSRVLLLKPNNRAMKVDEKGLNFLSDERLREGRSLLELS